MRRTTTIALLALVLTACGSAESTAIPTIETRPTTAPTAEVAPTEASSTGRPTSAPSDSGNTSSPGMPKQYASEPAMTIDVNKQYIATLKTQKGDIVIELNAKNAPRTVNNFVFLAREGFYDNVTFHRVIPGFMAQGGDPTGTGMGGPGYQFVNEYEDTTSNLLFDKAGVLAMANAGPNTNGSQFFITLAPAQHLTPDAYTIFGQVTAGQDVVDQITPRDPGMGGAPGDAILTITIEEK
ncbi:peptidylprolyl isomerase [Herpetosiphon gulosus]|uniref:Peptidyl-prolyl cis-trans isomerase n=1 Tax=Herpetosiphon gulosus TaxID=1973496 RepID=A0ABP9X306_9CHLR